LAKRDFFCARVIVHISSLVSGVLGCAPGLLA